MEQLPGGEALEVSQHDGVHPSEPVVKTRTPEQLALLQAAMMEELGIGRKDALPLEDRGYNDAGLDFKSLKKPTKRLDPNDPVARWHNIQFDDVDPAMGGLDSIADGQLYRLRRAAAPRGRPNQGSSHLGRGRGLLSYRGGCPASSNGHTLQMSAGRGNVQGLGHGSTRRRPEPASTSLVHGHRPPLGPRRVASHQTLIDRTIARLRGDSRAHPENPKAGSEQAPKQEKYAVHMLRKQRVPALPAPDTFLASPEVFLAKVGFNKASQDSKPATTTEQKLNRTSSLESLSSDDKSLLASNQVSKPRTDRTSVPTSINSALGSDQIPRSASSIPSTAKPSTSSDHPKNQDGSLGSNPPAKPSVGQSSQFPSHLVGAVGAIANQDVGLAGSRWADTAASFSSTPVTIPTVTHTPSSAAPNRVTTKIKNDETRFSSLADYNIVKIVQDGEASRNATLRVIRHHGQERCNIQIILDQVISTDEHLVDQATSEVTGSTVTFRTAHGFPIHQVTFSSPSEAKQFKDTWLIGMSDGWEDSPKKRDVPSHAIKVQADTSVKVAASRAIVRLPPQSGVGFYNHGSTNDNSRQFDDSSGDLPDDQPHGQLLDFNAPGQYGSSDRIRNDLLHDLSTLEGGQLLISFDDDDECVETHENISSALEDLFDLDNGPLLEGALEYLNGGSEGSFLEKTSRIVSPVPLRSPILNVDQVLASPPARSMAEKLVGEFFRRSEIFNQLALHSAANVIKRKTKSILEMAIHQRDHPRPVSLEANDGLVVVPECGLMQDMGQPTLGHGCIALEQTTSLTTELPSTNTQSSVTLAQSNNSFDSPQKVVSSATTSADATSVRRSNPTASGNTSRKTYTADELLKLRSSISSLSFEKIAKNSLTWKRQHNLVRPSRVSPNTNTLTKSIVLPRSQTPTHNQTQKMQIQSPPHTQTHHETQTQTQAHIYTHLSPQIQTAERLSANAKEFTPVEHKVTAEPKPPPTNRHRPTSSEWEMLTQKYEALSLDPEAPCTKSTLHSPSNDFNTARQSEPEQPQTIRGSEMACVHPPTAVPRLASQSNTNLQGTPKVFGPINLPRAAPQLATTININLPGAPKHSEPASTASIPRSTPPLENLSNKNPQAVPRHFAPSNPTRAAPPLAAATNVSPQGAPGLSASRWAAPGNSPTFMPAFQHPTLTPNQNFSPQIQTVLIPHPITGELQEYTGMVKVGSIPVVAPAPVRRVFGGPRLKENVPFVYPQNPGGPRLKESVPFVNLQNPARSPVRTSVNPSPVLNHWNGNACSTPQTPFSPNALLFQPTGYPPNLTRPPLASRPSSYHDTNGLFVPSMEDLQATQWYQNIAQSDSESPGSFHW